MEKHKESFAEILARKMNSTRSDTGGLYGISVEDELKAQFKETLHSSDLQEANKRARGKLHWF